METSIGDKFKTDTSEGPMLSDRVRKCKEGVINNSCRLDCERLKHMLESYPETETQPVTMRRARFFEKHLSNKTIFIDDNPLVGSMTRYTPGNQPMVEYSCKWMLKDVDQYSHMGKIVISDEEMEWLKKGVHYWQDKCVWYRTNEVFTEATGLSHPKIAKTGAYNEGCIFPLATVGPDFGKMLNKGLKGMISEVEEEMGKLPLGPLEDRRKLDFLRAVRICLNAVIVYAGRYAALAKEMAQKETDTERKEVLNRIASTMEWVPANPARDFYEALQAVWFIYVCCQIETEPVAISFGRLSDYMYPFYKKDKEEGKITDEEVVELLQLLFIKCLGSAFHQSAIVERMNQGQTATRIVIGGLTPEGKDASTELDWLVLEAQKYVKSPEPSLSFFYTDKMSEEFLLKAVEVVRETGMGQPQFMNNEVTIQRHLARHPGIPIEEAREISQQGCIQSTVAHRTGVTWEAALHMPQMLEFALNNGVDPLSGVKVGPETGDAEGFGSYEELHEAVKKQLQYFLPLIRQFDRIGYGYQAEIVPTPFQSAFIDDCIKEAKDITEGGARYYAQGTLVIGNIDLINSLAAIKTLVFDEKRISIKELKEVLAADFEGYEEIHRMCLEAPKYGNDIEWVDQFAKDWFDMYWDEHQEAGPDYLGRTAVPQAFSMTNHFNAGLSCGALPSGRKSKVSLTDATISAMPGTDTSGPTALANSAAKALDCIKYGSSHLNMKFHPSALEGREGLRKLLALIKTYMDSGGYHVQFNCVSGEALKDAQLDPDSYRDLVVRVAGFSAFFIHLEKGVQDEIIKRTELKFN